MLDHRHAGSRRARPSQSYGVLDADRVEAESTAAPSSTQPGRKAQAEDAPSNLAIIGRYILTPASSMRLERIPRAPAANCNSPTACEACLSAGEKIYGFTFEGKRHDAGDKLGFLKATVALGLKHPELGVKFREYLSTLQL